MEAYAHKNHRGNIEISIFQIAQNDKIIKVEETDAELSGEGSDVMPEVGHVVAVNGLTRNAIVVFCMPVEY